MYREPQCAKVLHRAMIQLELLCVCMFCSLDLLQHHLLHMLACGCEQGRPRILQSPPKQYDYAQGQKGLSPVIQ